MTLNELVEKAHDRAVRSGWWNPGKSAPEIHMLIVTELAEATECVRTGELDFSCLNVGVGDKLLKPEGEAVELADAIIRIADYFGHKGWNLEEIIKAKMAFNETRPHRHGDKKF